MLGGLSSPPSPGAEPAPCMCVGRDMFPIATQALLPQDAESGYLLPC